MVPSKADSAEFAATGALEFPVTGMTAAGVGATEVAVAAWATTFETGEIGALAFDDWEIAAWASLARDCSFDTAPGDPAGLQAARTRAGIKISRDNNL